MCAIKILKSMAKLTESWFFGFSGTLFSGKVKDVERKMWRVGGIDEQKRINNKICKIEQLGKLKASDDSCWREFGTRANKQSWTEVNHKANSCIN